MTTSTALRPPAVDLAAHRDTVEFTGWPGAKNSSSGRCSGSHSLSSMTQAPASRRPGLAVLFPTLLLASAASLAACGGGAAGAGGSSSSSASSATGTGGGGGATPQARVILRDHSGHPSVGVDILVHDLDGVATQQTKTDKTGAADVDLVAGGGITALWKAAQDVGDPEYTAVSVLGLAAGAEVRLVADVAPADALPAITHLSFTGVAPLQSADWDIVVSCLQESTAAEQILSYGGCRSSATYDLVAFLAPGDKRLVFPAQTPQPGMNVPLLLDPEKAEAAPPVAIAITGVPDGTSRLDALLSANRPEGGKTRYLASKDVTTTQNTFLQAARIIVSPGGSFDVDLTAETALGGIHTRLYFPDTALPTADIPWHVPAISVVSKIGTLMGTARRPQVPWSLDPIGAPSDAVRIQLEYQAFNPPPDGAAIHPARWTLYTVSTPSGVAKFPEIPESFPGFAPESQALKVLADHLDVPENNSLIAAVNADFDRVGSSFASRVFVSPAN